MCSWQSKVCDEERCVDVLFTHRVVQILGLSPRLQAKLLHKLNVFVYLRWFACDLLVSVLEEKEV